IGTTVTALLSLSDGQLATYNILRIYVSDNNPPEISSPITDVNFDEDSSLIGAFDLDDHFTDLETEDLNYSRHGNEFVFVVIDMNNTVEFYAVADWFGVERVTFRAEDELGALVEHTITVTVNPINDPPAFSNIPDQFCKVDFPKVLDLSPYVSDVDTPITSLIFTTDSSFVTVENHSLVFLYDTATKETVRITVRDEESQDNIIIEVTASNNIAPSISNIPKLVVKGGEVYLFSLWPYVNDPDDPLENIRVWTDSDFITVNADDNLLLQIDFPFEMTGDEEDVHVFFSDGQASNMTIIHIKITDENIPKRVTPLPNIFFHEDTVLTDAINLNDYFEHAQNYTYFGNANINITIEDGRVHLSAVADWSGTETITFRGTTGEAFAEDTIDIVVRPVNDPPTISQIPSYEKEVNEIWALNLLDYIHDIDTPNNLLTVSVDNPHVVLYSFNLYFQSSVETQDLIILTVSDDESSATAAFWVNVTARNNPPLYFGLLRTTHLMVGETWTVDLDEYFFDMDRDDLNFTCNNPNIVINPVTHEATWTPSKSDSTLEDVIFYASDGEATVESTPIDLVLEGEKSEPSPWESFWWVIPLCAVIISALLAFIMLTRRKEEEEEGYEIETDKAVQFLSTNGGNYIIKSETSDSAYKVFSGLMSIGFAGLCITTKQTESLVKRYNLHKAWLIKLTLTKETSINGEEEETKMVGMLALGDEERRDDQYIFSSNFNSIVNAIEEFLMSGENKMVLMDGLEYILGADEMIKYVGFIASIQAKLKLRNSCLLIPIDPRTLSEKEMSLLERETVNLGEILQNVEKGQDVEVETDVDEYIAESDAVEVEDEDSSKKWRLW
ncbi:MAG: DUF835 domain-containing protein, partial [Thermoplasmata archaeon]